MKCFAIFLCLTVNAFRMKREETWHWGYKDGNGDDWSSHVTECGKDRQSPIDIPVATAEKPLSDFVMTGYGGQAEWTATNTGHGIKFELANPDTDIITVSGGDLPGTYVLAQFHLHWGSDVAGGSEHLVDGERHFAEIHLVHYKQEYGNLSASVDESDGLAVLAFFVDVDGGHTSSYNLDYILGQHVNKKLLELESTHTFKYPLYSVIPYTVDNYYRYLGSLTTPTCNEAVVWTVFKDPIKILPITKELMLSFAKFEDSAETLVNNYRTEQLLGSRIVTFYSSDVTEEKEMPVTEMPVTEMPVTEETVTEETRFDKIKKFFKKKMIVDFFMNFFNNLNAQKVEEEG